MATFDRHLPLLVRNLSYSTNRQQLIKNINLEVNSAGITIILGHNGAGKSLLMKLLHGVLPATAGDIFWHRTKPGTDQYWRTFVLQKPTFFQRSVRFNLEFVLNIAKVPIEEREQLCQQVLNICGLSEVSERCASVLSGGEKQRLSLARAWVLDPGVILLDEPTVALDPPAIKTFEALIGQFEKNQTKVFMTTHDLAQAKRLANDIIFIDKGEIVEQRDAKDFFTSPHSKVAQNFLAGKL